MANLLRVEQVPGQDREIRYYDDGTSTAVNMPQGYYTNTPQSATQNIVPLTEPTTPADAYKGLIGQTGSEDYNQFYSNWLAQQRAAAEAPIDEAAIRQKTLEQFQAEIDALNQLYAQKRKEALQQIEAAKGSSAAIQARRGLLGSDFGAAQTATVQKAGEDVLSSLDAERAAKEQAILSEVRTAGSAEIEKQTAAKKEAMNAYLEALKSEGTKTAANKAETIRRILANNIAVNDNMLKTLAEQLGVPFEELKADYNIAKASQAASQATAELKAQKEALDIEKTSAEISNLKNQPEKEALGMEKTRAEISNLKNQPEKDMIAKGYAYVATPAQRDALKKQGYSITTLNGRTYAKPPQTKTIQIGKSDYLITFDEAGNIIGKTLLGSSGTGTGSKTSSGSTFNKKLAQSKIEQFFYQQSGNSKKVSPDDYYLAKQAWVEDGGKEEDFDTIFYKRLYTHPALNR
jgi:hypothetical protein